MHKTSRALKPKASVPQKTLKQAEFHTDQHLGNRL